jgi:hypothetical protein
MVCLVFFFFFSFLMFCVYSSFCEGLCVLLTCESFFFSVCHLIDVLYRARLYPLLILCYEFFVWN